MILFLSLILVVMIMAIAAMFATKIETIEMQIPEIETRMIESIENPISREEWHRRLARGFR